MRLYSSQSAAAEYITTHKSSLHPSTSYIQPVRIPPTVIEWVTCTTINALTAILVHKYILCVLRHHMMSRIVGQDSLALNSADLHEKRQIQSVKSNVIVQRGELGHRWLQCKDTTCVTFRSAFWH